MDYTKTDALKYARNCKKNGYPNGVIRRALAIEFELDEADIHEILEGISWTITHGEFERRNHGSKGILREGMGS